MASRDIKTTIVKLYQDAELAAADGYRRVLADTSVADVTVTLSEDVAGIVEVVKVSGSNSLSVGFNGNTCNGHAGPAAMAAMGSSARFIAGNSEWLLLQPLVIE